MGNCHPSKTNVILGFASVDIGFIGGTKSHVTLSCCIYPYFKYVICKVRRKFWTNCNVIVWCLKRRTTLQVSEVTHDPLVDWLYSFDALIHASKFSNYDVRCTCILMYTIFVSQVWKSSEKDSCTWKVYTSLYFEPVAAGKRFYK